jgi:predicted MFS family arabinose efflux permease
MSAATRVRAMPAVLVFVVMVTGVISSLGAPLIPSISRDLGVSLSAAQWSLTATLLIGVVSSPVMGRLGDGPRRRETLLGGLAVVIVGCVAPRITIRNNIAPTSLAAGMATEAFTWLSLGGTVGAGAALVGPLVEAAGWRSGAIVAATLPLGGDVGAAGAARPARLRYGYGGRESTAAGRCPRPPRGG